MSSWMRANVDPEALKDWNRGVAKARAAYDREHGLENETAYERKIRIAAVNRKAQRKKRAAA